MKKNFFGTMVVAAVLFGTYTYNEIPNEKIFTDFSLANIEALANGNTGESSSSYGRLKVVNCKCDNGKSGYTLRCRPDGGLEQCSSTQQGLRACYKTQLSINKPVDLICDSARSYDGE